MTNMGAMRVLRRAQWEREIRAAMRRARGSVAVAAQFIGVSKRQLQRWLMEPTFRDVERVAAGPVVGRKRGAAHCSKCGDADHNARTCRGGAPA